MSACPVGGAIYLTVSSANLALVTTAIVACNTAAYAGASYDGTDQRGDSWATGSMAQTLFNTVAAPNNANGAWGYCSSNNSGATSTFSDATSYHTGGVNTMMADGHVQFIKNSISLATWWALGTIPGARSSTPVPIDPVGDRSRFQDRVSIGGSCDSLEAAP